MIPEYRGWFNGFSHRHVEFVPKRPPTVSASSDPSKASLASRISKPIHIRSYSWAWLWILNHIPFKRSTMAVPYTYTTQDPKHPDKTKEHHYYLDARDVKALISREQLKQSPDKTNQEEISDNTLEEISQEEIEILTTQLDDLTAGRIHTIAPKIIYNTFQPQVSLHHTIHHDSDSEADSESEEGPPPYSPSSQYQRQQSMGQEPPPYSPPYSSASSQPHGANAARQTPQQRDVVIPQPQPHLSPPKPESSSSQAPAQAASAVQMPINLNRDQEDVWRLIYGSRILEGIQAAEGKMTAQDSIWSLFMSKVPSQVLDDELTEELHKSMGNVLHYIAHSQVNQGFLLLLLADCVKGGIGDVYMTIGYLSQALSVLQRFSDASFLQTPKGNGISTYQAILKMVIQGWSVDEDASISTRIIIKTHSKFIINHIFKADPSQQAHLLTQFVQCIQPTGEETIAALGKLKDALLKDDLIEFRPPSAASSSSSSSSSSSAPPVQSAPQPAAVGPFAQAGYQALTNAAKTAAQTIKTTSEYTFANMEELIQNKRAEMADKSVKELQDLYKNQSENIRQLIDLIRESLDPQQIPNEGRDSVNRWFLTDPQFSQYLSDYQCMDAIFALEALAKKDASGKWMSFLTVFQRPPTTLNDMIAWGLKDNSPAALESLPLNVPRPGQDYLHEYMRRKHSIEPLIGIVGALGGQVTERANPQGAYALENWPKYNADFLHGVLRDIRDISQSPNTSPVLQSFIGHPLQNYQIEARDAFMFLCQFQSMTGTFDQGKTTADFTFQEFIDLICTSPGLLHPSISHDMDRLHLLAALMDEQKDIVFKNGAKASPKDIYIFVFEKLAKEPTPEHAIAAEQFYVRLKMIDDHLKSFA